jgi:hypothetical protein
MTLPNLQLSLSKQKEINNTSTASVINNINIGSQELKQSSSAPVLRIDTPDNIKQFKEALILILISYFKNNIILLNNLLELSEKIITKVDDLKLLVSLLINTQPSSICVDVEELELKGCCAKVCKHLPRYRKINDIVIDKKQSFRVAYNQYYIQIGTEFKISLEYVLL